MDRAAEALLNDLQFKAVIAKLQLPERATVVADSWIYGWSPSAGRSYRMTDLNNTQARIRSMSRPASSALWSICE